MRSRSTLEWGGTAFGAVAQAVWCGVLASVLSSASWPALAAFAAATMLAAAAASRWASADPARLPRGRAVLAVVVLQGEAGFRHARPGVGLQRPVPQAHSDLRRVGAGHGTPKRTNVLAPAPNRSP